MVVVIFYGKNHKGEVHMFKKALKKLNNSKGFTLVELLAVIVILGIIVAIAVPAVGGIINKAETGASEAEVELIEDAARLAHINNEEFSTDTAGYTVGDLISDGYLDVDPAPTGHVEITVDETTGNATYNYVSGN